MKHLLTGVAVLAALAFAAPGWAQGANPSGGNAVGVPGPNPGGPGLTPYSGGAPPAATAPSPSPPSNYQNTSATPPSYPRHARHPYHKTVTYRRGGKKGYEVTGSTANQLNQEELARLQAGNYSNPSAPNYPGGAAPPPSYPPAQPSPPMGTTGGGAPYRP